MGAPFTRRKQYSSALPNILAALNDTYEYLKEQREYIEPESWS